jgi:sporulation integral membrane protein YtvI
MKYVSKYIRIILNILFPIVMTIIIIVFGSRLILFSMPLLIGACIAMIANPLVKLCEKRLKIVRKHSSALIVTLVLVTIITGLYASIAWLVTEGIRFAADLPSMYISAVEQVEAVALRFSDIFDMMPDTAKAIILNVTQNMSQYISTIVERLGQPTVEFAGNFAKKIPDVLIGFIFVILSSYFFIAKKDVIIELYEKRLSNRIRTTLSEISGRLKSIASGYVLAQLKIMLGVAVILAMGFLILGVEYSLLISIVVAILDFLPLFGTGTVLIPWAVIAIVNRDYHMAIGLSVIYVSTQAFRQFVQPKIVGDSIGLDPMHTLFLLFIGYKVAGIAGMIFAVPVGITAIEIYKFGFYDNCVANIKLLAKDIDDFRKGKK